MRKHYNNDKLKFYIGDVRNAESILCSSRALILFFMQPLSNKFCDACSGWRGQRQPCLAPIMSLPPPLRRCSASSASRQTKQLILSTPWEPRKQWWKKWLLQNHEISTQRKQQSLYSLRQCHGSWLCYPCLVEQMKANKPITITDWYDALSWWTWWSSLNLSSLPSNMWIRVTYSFKKPLPAQSVTLPKHCQLSDSKIKIIGTRHGEKAHETLMTMLWLRQRQKIWRLLPHSCW